MPERLARFAWVVKLVRVWTVASLVLLAGGFVATAVIAVMSVIAGTFLNTAIWLALAVLGELAGAVLVVVVCGLVETIVSNERAVRSADEHIQRLESLLEALHESNRRLVDLAQMSEAAKSLLFRDHEIDTIKEMVHEGLIRQDYAKAQALVQDMENRYGRCDEVERVRKEISSAKSTTIEQKIDAVLEHIGEHMEAHDWAQALRQTKRLLQLLPDNPKIAALPQLIHEARAKHKRQLLQEYGAAVKVSNIDRSIELLHELDNYLTPQEADALAESARGVFKAKLHSLGVQFAIEVTDEQWAQAVETGEQIVGEYPNTRMAEEVRQKMDQLRARAAARAGGEGAAAPGQ